MNKNDEKKEDKLWRKNKKNKRLESKKGFTQKRSRSEK